MRDNEKEGRGDVKNRLKLRDVIYERPLAICL